MHLLVTGATGLLGNNLVRMALARGDRVRVLARATSDPQALAGLDVERVEGDVRDAEAVARACRGVDAVIHSAALVHIGWTQADLARDINVVGTDNVLAGARAAGVRLLHVSSVDALGMGDWDRPANEETPFGGHIPTPYVLTKHEAEQRVLAAVAEGLDAVIVNPTYMLGPWDWKPSSGRMVLELATRWVPLAPPGGNNFVDVRDVAAGALVALERGQTGRRYILGGENLPYLEAFRMFARLNGGSGPVGTVGPVIGWLAGAAGDLWGRLVGREPDVNSAAVAAGALPHYYSSQRARDELDYTSRPAAEAAQAAWEWFRQRQ